MHPVDGLITDNSMSKKINRRVRISISFCDKSDKFRNRISKLINSNIDSIGSKQATTTKESKKKKKHNKNKKETHGIAKVNSATDLLNNEADEIDVKAKYVRKSLQNDTTHLPIYQDNISNLDELQYTTRSPLPEFKDKSILSNIKASFQGEEHNLKCIIV